MFINIKRIITQALVLGFVSTVNYFLFLFLNFTVVSYIWGLLSFWILIDDLCLYQDFKLLTNTNNDLKERYLTLDKDFKLLLKQKYEQTRYLTNIIKENTLILNDVKKLTSPVSSPTRILHIKPRNRLALINNNSCVW
jgi:ABC-type siderophore export system fused ATPase/permease subunit